VVESVRVPGEVEELKKAGGILLSVDADIEKRYERIVARKSETDQVSFEEFRENEEREMNSSDPDKQNITAVMRMADIHLENNGSIDDLKRAVKEKIL
jgi:dephospho-CoA kinase